MHKKFEINRTKTKGGCQLGRKVVAHDSKIDLPLGIVIVYQKKLIVAKSYDMLHIPTLKKSWVYLYMGPDYLYSIYLAMVELISS